MSFAHHTPVGQPDHSKRQAVGEVKNAKCRMQNVKWNKKRCPLRSAPKACVLQGTTLFCSVVLAPFQRGFPRRRQENRGVLDGRLGFSNGVFHGGVGGGLVALVDGRCQRTIVHTSISLAPRLAKAK